MSEITISIDGMRCAGCVRSVEQALRKLPGVRVHGVTVGSARLALDDALTDRSAIERAIESAGFTPQNR